MQNATEFACSFGENRRLHTRNFAEKDRQWTNKTLVASDIQRATLGSIYMDARFLAGPLSTLAITDFVGALDQEIFATMLSMASDNQTFDALLIAREVAEKTGQDEISVSAYIAGLVDGAVADENVARAHGETLQKLSQLRRFMYFSEEIARKALARGADPGLLLKESEESIRLLRHGHDLTNNLLPYAPRDWSVHPEIVRLADVQPRAVDWLWRPYLPFGMPAILSGDPGAGKTYVSLAIAADLTRGRQPFTGHLCTPVSVLYLSSENPLEHVVRPRFDSLGGDSTRFHALVGSIRARGSRDERTSIKLSDLTILETALNSTNARLVIIDPIQSYLGADVDAHRANETRPILDGLARLSQKFNACFLMLRHFAKSPASRAIHRGLGSIDLTGAVRSELHAGTVDDTRVVAHAKSNIGQLGTSLCYEIDAHGVFRWKGETEVTAGDLQAPEQTGDERTAMAEACDLLRGILAAGPRPSEEVESEVRSAGISTATFRRAKKKLGIVSQKLGMKEGWQLSLPEDVYQSVEDAQVERLSILATT